MNRAPSQLQLLKDSSDLLRPFCCICWTARRALSVRRSLLASRLSLVRA